MKITKFVPDAVSSKVGGQAVKLKKNSPHLFFGLGLAGVVGGTVLACRATLKAEPVLDEMKEDIDGVKEDLDGDKRDLAYVYAKGTYRLGKLYAPAVLVGGAGIVCLTGSHVQLTKRNNALAAAYTVLHHTFEEYRSRVQDELGAEKERDLYFGAEKKTVKRDGEKIEVMEFDPNKPSAYAVFFDEYSANWVKDAEYNHAFVTAQQHYFNQLLQMRGYVYLNDVYKALGVPETKAGQVVGWNLKNPKSDGYIDFNIYNPENSQFVNKAERSILLDFNVDGVIWEYMEE